MCCICKHCPLVLSWATTVHKFQGFEAGFDEDDTVNYIIADINNLTWESPGTAYVVTSRAKTIGQVTESTPYPKRSNLFFDGTICEDRFMNGTVRVMEKDALQSRRGKRGLDTSIREAATQEQDKKLRLQRNARHS